MNFASYQVHALETCEFRPRTTAGIIDAICSGGRKPELKRVPRPSRALCERVGFLHHKMPICDEWKLLRPSPWKSGPSGVQFHDILYKTFRDIPAGPRCQTETNYAALKAPPFHGILWRRRRW